MIAVYRWVPDIKTLREAVFCGHFGPMGLGALFLAIEARAVLENGTSTPDSHPPAYGEPFTSREIAIATVWPVISFVVFGSTLVHGLSVLALSLFTHFLRDTPALNLTMYLPVVSPSNFSILLREVGAARATPARDAVRRATSELKKRILSSIAG